MCVVCDTKDTKRECDCECFRKVVRFCGWYGEEDGRLSARVCLCYIEANVRNISVEYAGELYEYMCGVIKKCIVFFFWVYCIGCRVNGFRKVSIRFPSPRYTNGYSYQCTL